MTDVLNTDGIGSDSDWLNRLSSHSDQEPGQGLSSELIASRRKGGVMVVDHNFKVVMIDRKAAQFCGVSPGQSQGKRFYSLFPTLLGSLFASELHQAVTSVACKRCSRPNYSQLIDQVYQAFPSQKSMSKQPLDAIVISAYKDGSSVYGLIQLQFDDQHDEAPLRSDDETPAQPAQNATSAPQSCSISFEGSAIVVVDSYGYISSISQDAEQLFGYRDQLLKGSSVRILFPQLNNLQEGCDIAASLSILASQSPQGHLMAATSAGETKRLDVQIFRCANDRGELVLHCRDFIEAGLKIEQLINRGQLFATTAKSVADGVMVVDAEGFVVEMNPIAEQLLGVELNHSKAVQIQTVMPLANEETGIRVTPVEDALNQVSNIEISESLLLKVRGAEPMTVAISAFPMRNGLGRVEKCLVIFRPLSEARRVSSRLRWQSMHDPLTGLPNRKSLAGRIQRAIESAKREGSIHALLYIDLYNFSVINDTSGHMAGDELLVQFAHLLMEVTGPNDIAARIGNDEFALLLHCINYDKAIAMAEQVLEAIKNFSILWDGETLKVGASIGGIMVDSNALSDIDLMISAGSSCAAARDKGRNKIHFQSFNEEVTKRRRLATSMPKLVSALDENRFTLFAQPILSLNPNVALPKYYEILVRMRDSDGTILPPSEFIPVAEHFSLIDDLDKWVFTNALKFLQQYQKTSALLPTLAVNLSGSTVGDENAIDYILAGFSDSGISPKHIQFEITETAAVKHLSEAKRLIATLRSVGVSFALDDFGSGLSSFAYLKELPIDCLKIDSGFIQTMDNSDVDYSVVSTINHLGHIMGVSTAAEGVENKMQHQLLKKIGVDYVQGFQIQHPEALDKIIPVY
ncbi:EAL domain-containing protein [Porticoccaceae bacterium]|nr:EAL domain-containing protein [Porticoccaceae bacterium]